MHKEQIVSKIMQGAIDVHSHTAPSIFPRVADSIEVLRQAKDYGMKAVVLKCHHTLTADRATLLNKVISGIKAYGGIVLNRYVGGINPYAVEVAIRLGAKIVWMPTQWAQHHLNVYGKPEYKHMEQTSSTAQLPFQGISIVNDNGQLTSDAKQVLELIKDSGVALGTSHLSKDEIKILVNEANKMKINKIIITHITLSELWEWSIEEQKELIEKGATIEHVALYCMKNRYLISPKEVAELIEGVGYNNVVISSDCGQLHNPASPDALKLFISMLLETGIRKHELEYMVKENPAWLLGLD